MFLTLRISVLCVLIVGSTVIADSTEDGASVRSVQNLAEQGDAEAQISLGIMYDYGRGVPEDDTEAVKWYRKAAEQGVAKAQYNLGVMYTNGRACCRTMPRP